MTCHSCGKPVTGETSFDIGGSVLCVECFTQKAQHRSNLTPDEHQRLKKAVKEEMGAIIPMGTIRGYIEECCDAIAKGEDPDEMIGRAVNRVAQAAGLALGEHIQDVIKSMQQSLAGELETIRDQMKKLGTL